MESYQEELAQIKAILKNNPKGMTVSDIAREIHINRNSVAKYLDILLISGHVEMVTFGPAKVFFPSSRIPLTALLNLSHDYIALLNRDLKFLQVSENLLRFIEIQRSDIIGRPIQTFAVSFFQLPELAHNAKKALEGTEQSIEKQYKQNNQAFYLRIKHIPTTFDDGEPGVTVVIEDITDRKQTEEKMKRTVQEWEIIFHSISDMVFIQDNDFVILRANRAFAQFLNSTPAACVGKKFHQLLSGLDTPKVPLLSAEVQHTKKPATVGFYVSSLNKYLELSALPLFADSGDVIGSVCIMRDITERKKTTETP
ncbi:MAG: PAS domain-containing protein [Candidatus Thermoplasmatota archaeon]